MNDITKLLKKASGLFSESGFQKLEESVKDGTLESLSNLKNKVGALSNFKEKYFSANAEMKQKILNNISDNDLMDEIVNSVEGRRAILDDIMPNHGIEAPKKPSASRNSTKNKDKEAWARYDKNLEEYNTRINDYYDAAFSESTTKQGQVDELVAKAEAQDTVTSGFDEPNFTILNPNSSSSNAGAGQSEIVNPHLPSVVENNTSVSTGPSPMSEAEAKMKEKARRQAAMRNHAKEREKLRNQLSAFDESIRTQKTDMSLLRRTGEFFKELWTGTGESSRWLRGRNTRKQYYDQIGNLADDLGKSIGINASGHSYNRLTNNFRSNVYHEMHGIWSDGYIMAGGKAGGIRGGYVSEKSMTNDPNLMVKMFSGDYGKAGKVEKTLDGISEWTKEHQLIVAGGIAAAGIGVGGLLANSNNKDRGY